MNNKDIYIGINEGRHKDVMVQINRGGGSGYARAMMDTTENWNNKPLFVPQKGLIIVYSDKEPIIRDGRVVNVAGIKIGDGNAYLIDLPFIGDEYASILDNHINDMSIHVTPEEKAFWDNKLNYELNAETLILNRD